MKEHPPPPSTAFEEIEQADLRTQSFSGPSTVEIHNNPLYVEEKSTTDGGTSSVDQNFAGATTSTIPPLSPPPTPPTPPTFESSESDLDMGHGSAHIPLYEGDEDPRRHWFICESTWEANQVTDEDRQMAQFIGALRKMALTWYMTFLERQPREMKDEIKE